MAVSRRVARLIIWTIGGCALVLAAAVSLAQGSGPVDWDLQNVHLPHMPHIPQSIPDSLQHLNALQDRMGHDLHDLGQSMGIDPYLHAAAEAAYGRAQVFALTPD